MKVIAFDSWTAGYFHFSRLLQSFGDYGFNLKLIHLGSWGHDKNRPRFEIIDGLPVYDISFYGKKSFLEILTYEKPDAIIFLCTEAFAHRAFNRYAKILGIPTLNLYHGLLAVQAVESGKPDKFNFFAQTKLILVRLFKNIFIIWPIYLRALILTKASFSEYIKFCDHIFCKIFGKYIRVLGIDSQTSACAVYTVADIDHAKIKFHLDNSQIKVVGNPDLLKFNFQEKHFGCCLQEKIKSKKILYIDHGGSTCGLNFNSPADFLNFLITLRSKLLTFNYELIIKLHPSQLKAGFDDNVKSSGLYVCDDSNFLSAMQYCDAVITGPSSASILPALMGLPILLLRFGPFTGQKYGKILNTYPRTIILDEVMEIDNLICEEANRVNFSKV